MIVISLVFLTFLLLVRSQDYITLIAGSSTTAGYSGDNGAATSARLNLPEAIAVDASGIVFHPLMLYHLLFTVLSRQVMCI